MFTGLCQTFYVGLTTLNVRLKVLHTYTHSKQLFNKTINQQINQEIVSRPTVSWACQKILIVKFFIKVSTGCELNVIKLFVFRKE